MLIVTHKIKYELCMAIEGKSKEQNAGKVGANLSKRFLNSNNNYA